MRAGKGAPPEQDIKCFSTRKNAKPDLLGQEDVGRLARRRIKQVSIIFASPVRVQDGWDRNHRLPNCKLRNLTNATVGGQMLPQKHKIAQRIRMSALRIALYQPDIPGNTGTILRFAACLGLAVDLIEPAGFDVSDRNLKRAGMDYLAMAALTRHVNYERFYETVRENGRRLVLASTKAALPYADFEFQPGDTLLFGRESAGVPDHVHERAEARILIPMVPGQRSINLALSVAMIAGEALRQTAGFPASP